MKRRLIALGLVFCMVLSLSACGNKAFIDTTYTFNRAIIKLPNDEVIEVKIKQWTDFGDGDQIQITDEDNQVYLVHSINCVLLAN